MYAHMYAYIYIYTYKCYMAASNFPKHFTQMKFFYFYFLWFSSSYNVVFIYHYISFLGKNVIFPLSGFFLSEINL